MLCNVPAPCMRRYAIAVRHIDKQKPEFPCNLADFPRRLTICSNPRGLNSRHMGFISGAFGMKSNRLLLAVTTVLSLIGPALSAGADGTSVTQTASTAQPPVDIAALKALFARPTEIPFPK